MYLVKFKQYGLDCYTEFSTEQEAKDFVNKYGLFEHQIEKPTVYVLVIIDVFDRVTAIRASKNRSLLEKYDRDTRMIYGSEIASTMIKLRTIE